MKRTITEPHGDTAVHRILVEKRGRGKLDPNKTPIHKVHQDFLLEQRGKGNSDATIVFYERCFKQFFKFLAAEIPEEDMLTKIVEGGAVEGYLAAIPVSFLEMDKIELKYRIFLLDEMGVSEVTVDTYFRAFRAFSYYCMQEGWIEPRKITVKSTQANIKDCYTEKEIARLIKKPDKKNFTEYRNWVIINLLLACAIRVGSLTDINVEDVNLEQGYMNINRLKNKKPMSLGMIKKMTSILHEYIGIYRTELGGVEVRGDEPLFCNRFGERMSAEGVKKAIAEYNKSRGVEKTSIHLFRHTFAKDWIMRGGDLFTLQKMLGHSSLKMVQQYSNLYASDAKAKAEEFSLLANIPITSGDTLTTKRRVSIDRRV
jgi:integrase/recombinase XerD